MNQLGLICWDRLRADLVASLKTSWGKNELLKYLGDIEREESRKLLEQALQK